MNEYDESLDELPRRERINPWDSAGKRYPHTGRILHTGCAAERCRWARHQENNR